MTTAILITGASSGIGHATALRLARRPEVTVFATARDPGSLTDLAQMGARTLALDVTDETSMVAAVSAVEAEFDAVGALVNNAGYGEYGTIEETDLGRARREFETNVFGLARMTQLVLPAMRRARLGRIVNVGSMGGRIVFPAGGYYHASKYAVEAITDALRFEVGPFGIKVVLVEPGIIRTGFGETAASTLAESNTLAGPYAPLNRAVDVQMDHSYRSRWISAPPDAVAEVIEQALFAPKPRARYVVTPAAKVLVQTRRLLGSRVFDAYLRQQFKAGG